MLKNQKKMNENSTSSSSITTFSSPNTTLPSEQSQNNVNALKSSISDLAFGFESIFRPEFDSVCSHLQELMYVFVVENDFYDQNDVNNN